MLEVNLSLGDKLWEEIDKIFGEFNPDKPTNSPYMAVTNVGAPPRNSFYYLFEDSKYNTRKKGWNYDNPCFGVFLKSVCGMTTQKISVFGTNASKFPRDEFTDSFVGEFLTSSICAPWIHCPDVDYWFNKGFVVDLSAPYGVVVAASHAARYVTEHPEVFDHYKGFLELGFKSKYAYVLALMYQCTYSSRHHSRWGANGCTYTYSMSNVNLKDILEQKLGDHTHKPFNETTEPYGNSVERLFPKSSKPTNLAVYDANYTTLEAFLAGIFRFTELDQKDFK